MIRLRALQAFTKILKRWCYRLAFPLLISAWSWSSEEQEAWRRWAPPIAFLFAVLHYHAEEREKPMTAEPNKATNEFSKDASTARPFPPKPTRTMQQTTQQKETVSTSCSNLTGLPTDILNSICGFLTPQDVTKALTLNRAAAKQFTHNQIWKSLWYRDFGNVLLKWNVGRQVLAKSIGVFNEEGMLEESLSQYLSNSLSISLQEFYFVFGEVYTNYLLAGRNAATNCYLGLHGHIFDFASFADYHPGLAIDEVLLECGQDATTYFEQLPHSTGARNIARQLVVLVHQGILGRGCGLALRLRPSNLHQLLRRSNSRPLALRDSSNPEEAEWLKQLLPRKPRSPARRPPTLERIRTKWDELLKEQRAQLSPSHWRVYYDPLQERWIQWNAKATLNG